MSVSRSDGFGTSSCCSGDGFIVSAAAQQHIDAYLQYDMLVGEADGGVPLPAASYKKLQQLAAACYQDKLFVTWRSSSGSDCHNVGPSTRCICKHSYRAHRWWELESKEVGCRVPGCPCRCYSYVPMRGNCAARCACKHELDDHRLGLRCCRCSCTGYAPPQRCDCGLSYSEHSTCFETRSQRHASGRAAVAVGGGRPDFEAATGAVTDMTSLLPAGDRAMIQQQHVSHPLLMQPNIPTRAILHSADPPISCASSVMLRIHGVKGANAPKVNGIYWSHGNERQGGQLLWRGQHASAVIECMPSRRSWQVKPESSLGKDGCWAAISCEGELQSVRGCSGWRIWDGSSKTFHEQPDVRLEVCDAAAEAASASASASLTKAGSHAPIADMYRSLSGPCPSSSAPSVLQQVERDIDALEQKLSQAQLSGSSQPQLYAINKQLQIKKAEHIRMKRAEADLH